MKVHNAIIMAAGTSSRFAPLSYETHKAMTIVRGEVLIERQIKQLQEAKVPQIIIVTGYKAEQFSSLADKYGIQLVHNSEYLTRNNNSSIWAAKEFLGNSYVCSADNYFTSNPFESDVDGSYYAAEYADGPTAEWCMEEDSEGFIRSVSIGGKNSWYMLGHTFWSQEYASRFLSILEEEYDRPGTAEKLWEKIFMEHLDVLKMRIRKYAPGVINEFDTLDELRQFDASYITDTRSAMIKKAAKQLGTSEDRIVRIKPKKGSTTEAVGFEFDCCGEHYSFLYKTQKLEKQGRLS